MESKGNNKPSANQYATTNSTELLNCPVLTPEYVPNRAACPLIPVLEELATGVIISDHDGRFTVFNREEERILGIGAQRVGPSRWSEVYGCYRPDKVTAFPAEDLPLVRALRGDEVRGEKMFIRNSAQPKGVWIRASSRPSVKQPELLAVQWWCLATSRRTKLRSRASNYFPEPSNKQPTAS